MRCAAADQRGCRLRQPRFRRGVGGPQDRPGQRGKPLAQATRRARARSTRASRSRASSRQRQRALGFAVGRRRSLGARPAAGAIRARPAPAAPFGQRPCSARRVTAACCGVAPQRPAAGERLARSPAVRARDLRHRGRQHRARINDVAHRARPQHRTAPTGRRRKLLERRGQPRDRLLALRPSRSRSVGALAARSARTARSAAAIPASACWMRAASAAASRAVRSAASPRPRWASAFEPTGCAARPRAGSGEAPGSKPCAVSPGSARLGRAARPRRAVASSAVERQEHAAGARPRPRDILPDDRGDRQAMLVARNNCSSSIARASRCGQVAVPNASSRSAVVALGRRMAVGRAEHEARLADAAVAPLPSRRGEALRRRARARARRAARCGRGSRVQECGRRVSGSSVSFSGHVMRLAIARRPARPRASGRSSRERSRGAAWARLRAHAA